MTDYWTWFHFVVIGLVWWAAYAQGARDRDRRIDHLRRALDLKTSQHEETRRLVSFLAVRGSDIDERVNWD